MMLPTVSASGLSWMLNEPRCSFGGLSSGSRMESGVYNLERRWCEEHHQLLYLQLLTTSLLKDTEFCLSIFSIAMFFCTKTITSVALAISTIFIGVSAAPAGKNISARAVVRLNFQLTSTCMYSCLIPTSLDSQGLLQSHPHRSWQCSPRLAL